MIASELIVHSLEEALKPLTYVHAVWLEGAHANGTEDAYRCYSKMAQYSSPQYFLINSSRPEICRSFLYSTGFF